MQFRILGVISLLFSAMAFAGEPSSDLNFLSGNHALGIGSGKLSHPVNSSFQPSAGRPGADASATHVYVKPPGGLKAPWKEGSCLSIGICSYSLNGKTYYFVNELQSRYFKDGKPTSEWVAEGNDVYRLNGSNTRITFHSQTGPGTELVPSKADTTERSPNIISVSSKEDFSNRLYGLGGKTAESRNEAILVFTAHEGCGACTQFAPTLNKFADKMKSTVAVYEIDVSMLFKDPPTDPAERKKYDALDVWVRDKISGAANAEGRDSYPFVARWKKTGGVWDIREDSSGELVRGEPARQYVEKNAE